MEEIISQTTSDEYWRGFEFSAYNYYIDRLSASEADLNNIILEHSGRDIIVISHPIYFFPR